MWQVWSYAPTCDKWPHKWSHEIILTIWDNSDCMLTEWDVWLHVIVWAPCNDCDNKGKMWSLATNVTKCGKCDQHVNNVNNFTTCDRWKVWLHVINLSTCDLVWQLWPQNTSATTCDTCEIVTCDKSDHMWQVWSYVSCVTTCDMSCDPRWIRSFSYSQIYGNPQKWNLTSYYCSWCLKKQLIWILFFRVPKIWHSGLPCLRQLSVNPKVH